MFDCTTPTQDGSTHAHCFCERDTVCDACMREVALSRMFGCIAAETHPEPDPWAQYRD